MATVAVPQLDEIRESLDQWVKFCSCLPNPARGGEIIHEPGLVIACSQTVWPMGNLAVFTTPVESSADLTRRIEIVHSGLTERGCSGVFFIADSLVALVGAEASQVFARHGYEPMLAITGMATDALVAPVRPTPELQYCTVSDAASRRIVGELNAIAYEVPLEWGRDYDERTDVWSHGAYGIVGFVNDRPAACAVTVPLDGRLYMALVATAHDFRRLGCAEAVMRRSLEDAEKATGFRRTVLHGTPMGRPLYAQMGYHDTLPFTVYAQHH